VRSLGHIRILFSLVLLGFGSFFNGCSKASFYPALGATGGAAVGSLGGPGTAAGGAALGWGVGEVSKYVEENKHLTDQVKALSEGDVQQLVKNQLDESMDDGFFDGMLTEIYGLLKLCLVGVVLWNVIPIIYTRYVHKKTKNGVSS
tara:strand:- start:35 stop:472 length:438 start_codon:yes stop_codon:yes gene_type:complete